MTGFLARHEHLALVDSTNDVVRAWLADGTPEVCLAVADEQTAGRGREGRRWVAPAGAALLLSVGFRPTWLAPEHVWRLAATVTIAMAEAAEATTGLPDGTIRLKWPNDLVIGSSGVRKLAGVLGETDGLGGPDPRAVIGLGLNTDWPAAAFPSDLAASMTSLREVADGRPLDDVALLAAFLHRLEIRTEALRAGRFDGDVWTERQATTGREVDLVAPDGAVTAVRALGVDDATGALVVEDRAVAGGRRHVLVGEIRHVRVPAVSAAHATTESLAGV